MKCELKKETKNEIFYRYDIDGNKVWFTQHEDGDIFTVYIAQNEKLSGIEFYVDIEYREIHYPKNIYIRTTHNLLRTPKEIDEYVEKLQYAKGISEKIMEIFKLKEHRR